jgi:hypothetical protein
LPCPPSWKQRAIKVGWAHVLPRASRQHRFAFVGFSLGFSMLRKACLPANDLKPQNHRADHSLSLEFSTLRLNPSTRNFLLLSLTLTDLKKILREADNTPVSLKGLNFSGGRMYPHSAFDDLSSRCLRSLRLPFPSKSHLFCLIWCRHWQDCQLFHNFLRTVHVVGICLSQLCVFCGARFDAE